MGGLHRGIQEVNWLLTGVLDILLGIQPVEKYVPQLTNHVDSCIVVAVATNSGNLAYGCPNRPNFIVERRGYALGYDNIHRQALWVSYALTADHVINRVARRGDFFAEDPVLLGFSSTLADYRGSGYDRGHLCPAADQAWSKETMRDSFYMSNMSPQTPMFNRGIWRELEHWTREQAVAHTNIFVYTGPIFSTNHMRKTVGLSRVTVPEAYYKILLDESSPRRTIGFVLPNQASTNSYLLYVRTVRDIESLTGLDFFSTLPREEQDKIETVTDWKIVDDVTQ